MTLKISDVQSFVTDFLTPISKINDSCILKVNSESFQSVVTSMDNSMVLFGTYDQSNNDISESITLNISDISKLIKILGCINVTSIELLLDGNNIKYVSDNINFTYHLLADNILSEPGIDINKIKKLDFNFSFKMERDVITDLIKGSTFTTDTNKIYFYLKENAVHGQLTDLQKQNTDMYSQKLSDEYNGDEINEPIPVNFELIRNISSLRADCITTKLCISNKVFIFHSKNNESNLTYIVSAFIN
jgi:hypothetical protein